MEKKIFLPALIAACAIGQGYAQGKLDAHTQAFLLNRETCRTAEVATPRSVFPAIIDEGGREMARVIVTLEEGCPVPDDLAMSGAEIEARIGDMLIIKAPVDSLERLTEVEGVRKVSIERPIRLKNSNTRSETRQSEVNEATDNDGNYLTGKGVVVGMVDTGIDYNHLNFMDSDGNSRVKYAINGTTEYTDSASIAALTTDNTSYYHGSHTTGTVAGGYTGNGLQGMAPEADLALCGMNDTFTDATVLLACKGIIDFADSVGEPAVINMSIGSSDGPHDGSDALCAGLDALCKEGVVMVVAAGNEGDMQIYVGKEFTDTDTCMSTIVYDIDYKGNYYYNNVQVFSFDNTLPKAQFFVVSAKTNEILFSTDTIALTESESSWALSSQSDYSLFKTYYITYSGYAPDITVTADFSDDKSYLDIIVVGRTSSSSSYYVGLTLIGESGRTIHMWGADAYTEFISNGNDSFTDGDSSKSFSSMACGDYPISVGSYNAVNKYTAINGNTYSYSAYPTGYVSSFSSYGVDMRGIARPDVCAPGIAVLSSYNSYGSSTTSSLVSQVDYNDRTYSWGTCAGTSMATAVVSGIVATWLQYRPTLTGPDVREVLQNTSVVDSYVEEGDSVQWGSGKVDAYAGLEYLMTSGVNDVEVSQDNVLIYPNPCDGSFKVYTQGAYDGARLDVYSLSGMLVHSSRVQASEAAVDVDLSGTLAKGIYLVRITSDKISHCSRLIVK